MNIQKDDKGRTLYYVAVDAIIVKNGKVLLQRRANTGWNDGKYNLVGGHIENEESVQECIVRELKEELGIKVKPNSVQVCHIMQHKTDRQTIQFYVLVDTWKGTPTIQPELANGKKIYKADTLNWFDINNLPQEIIPSARQAIKCYAAGTPFSQLGYQFEEK